MGRFIIISAVYLILIFSGCINRAAVSTDNEIITTQSGVPEVVETPFEKGETLVLEGTHLFEQEKTAEALKVWKKALAYLGNDAELLNWLGVGYFKMDNYDSAAFYYEKAIESSPNHYQAYNNLGYIYFIRKNYHKAMENFKKALAINPYFEQARLNFETTEKIIDGELTFKALELFEKAASEDSLEIKLKYYKNAVKLDGQYVEAYNNMGVAFYYLGNVDSSIIYLNKAIKIESNYPEANNNLGFILSQLGLDDKAVPLYLTALNAKPNYLVAMINLSDSYVRLKQYDNARKIIASAQKLAPDNWMVRKRVRQVEYLLKQN